MRFLNFFFVLKTELDKNEKVQTVVKSKPVEIRIYCFGITYCDI